MARNRSKPQALLFEELEPRLLFSADIAEPVAAEVIQEELQEEVVIIIADAPEQIDAPADTVSENPAEIPSSADSQGETQSSEDITESTDAAPVSDTETIPSESETASSEDPSPDTNQNTPDSITGEDTTTASLLDTETNSAIILDDIAGQRNELVLINDNVRDIDELISGIDLPENSSSTMEVIILDTGQNGIEQVSDILADYENLDAIHVFTHGRDSSLALGSDWLDTNDLLENSDAVSGWGQALSEDGDILLYGCSIAAGDGGQDFVDSLAELTKADVSASDDPTGHDELGGDWELEYLAGATETSNPLKQETIQRWEQVLAATIADDFNTVTYDGSTGSVPWNNDWQEIGESDGAAAGNVSVFTSSQFGNARGIDLWKKPVGIWREANLSGATSATLSFDWGMLYTDDFDTVTLEISTDGGTNWNLVDTYTGPLTHSSLQAASYDISSFIDNDTRIKFETTTFSDNDEFFFDNVVIDFNANIITVNTTNDVDDGDHDSISDLIADPGADGVISLREAIIAANNTPGLDRINFDIPGIGPHVITLDHNNGELDFIDNAVIIDGTSEPDYIDAPVIQIDGSGMSAESGDNYCGFHLVSGSDGSTIRGLSITGFTDGGSYGNAIDIMSDNNVIAGNYLGIAPDGTTPDGNKVGVNLHNGADFNTIGGSSDGDKNLISASIYAGIEIRDSISSDNWIVGNDFGLDVNGDEIVSGTFGVLVWNGASNNIIGGVNAGEGNRITGHREGVVIDNAANPGLNNAILGNEIWDNREMAIDLNNDGISENDIGDTDNGPNDELNFPIITSVNQNGADLELSFNLEVPAGDYRIEFFENPNGVNGTGLGEGQTFLGAVTVTSNGTGSEAFNEVLSSITPSTLTTLSATATEFFGGTSYGSTSEFGPSTTTIATLTAIKDTYLSDDAKTVNYGDSTSLIVDKSGGDFGDGRVLLQFDLSSIPVGATITSATLQLNATSNSAPFPISVYEVTEDWQEGTGGTGAADWDYRQSPEILLNEWSTPGGTIDSTIIASLDTTATGLHSWDITSLAQAWYNGTTPNNGLMLASEESGDEIVTYDSRETLNPPQLILTFALPPNTAPVIDTSATPLLDPVLENNGAPSGAVGTLVSDLVDLQGGGGIDNVTDPDAGAQTGIALRFADEANGIWHYSTDDGANWNLVGSVNNNSARLLAADGQTRIYFQSNAGYLGTITDALVFKAWDQTSGINGGLGDTTPSGGTTAFSSATETANMTVIEIHDIKETVNPIVVDGVLDNSWSLTTTHDITHLTEGAVDNAADLSGTWRSMWDDTYLYAVIEVNDDTIINDSGAFTWFDDSIELYIDPDYSHGSSYDGINDYSLTIRAEDGAVFLGLNSTSDTSGVLSSISSVPGSYIVEIAVPWTKFGVIPVDGSFVGMDVQINDDDTGFGRDAKLNWHDTADEAWFNPSVFGTMQLLANNPPTIGGTDTGTVTEDIDPDSDDLLEISSSLTIADADAGESVFMAETVIGTYGDLSINALGIWDYSADNTQAAIQQLDAGQSVTDTLTVTTADGTTHDITITINGAEDAPIISGPVTGSVAEDGSLIVSNALTITDADANDNPISFTDAGPVAGSGGYGTFAMAANTWTYTLNNGLAAVQALDNGESVTDSYSFSANDGSTQLVTITINGAEDAPTVDTPIGDQSATEDTPFSFTFAGDAFGDLDANDTLSYSATLDNDSALPAWLSFTGVTRTFSGTPVNSDVGSFNVKVIADDGTSTIDDIFTITVINTDDPPVIGGTDTGVVTEDIDPDSDNLLEVASALSISDDDIGESSFIAETITGTYGDLSIDALGNWDYSADTTQAAIQQLDAGQSVTDTLTVATADGTTHDIVITINGAEDAPVIGGTATGSVSEDSSLSDTNTLTITDVDTNDNPISYNNVASTAGDNGYGTFAMALNSWTYTLNNSLAAVQALDTGESLTDTFTFMASDGATSQTVTITINGAEDAPTVDSPIADQIATEDSAFSFTFANTAFGDVDSSDTLTYTATLDDDSALPAWLSFTGATRTFSGTPANDDVGTINVKVTADDGSSTVFDIFTITVNNTDDPPVIGGTDTATVTEDIDPDSDNLLEVSSALSIADDDVGESSFIAETITGTYGDLTIDATGNWDYSADNTQAAIQQLDASQSVTDTLSVTTADGTTHDVVITINGTEDTPLLGGITTGTVTEDGSLSDTDTLTITDVDANDNPISYDNVASTAGDNGYGDFAMAANTWTYTLNNSLAAVQALDTGESLTDTFTFMASDGATSQTVTITINGAEDAPTVDFPINNQSATEDLPFNFTFNANTFGDLDTSDTLSYTATLDDDSPLPTWLNFDDASRSFTGTPTNSDVGTFNVKISADDGSSTVFDIFSITVFNTSDPPVITGTDTGSVTEDDDPDLDTLLEASGSLTIVDPDIGESSFIADTITGTYGDLTIDALGNWDYSADTTQAAIQQLDAGQSVTDTLSVTTFDGTSHDIVITINGAEDVPIIGGTTTGSVSEDGSLNDIHTLTITDVDANDNPISYNNVASTAGDNGYGNFAMATNTWTYSLNNSLAAVQALDTGESLTDTFTFMASDGITTQTITVTINGAEDAPTVDNPIGDQIATEDTAFSFTFAGNAFGDVDSSDTLTYTATLDDDSALPAWLSFDGAARTFSGTPTNVDVGTINIKVTADDGSSTVFDTFAITVNNTDDPPVISGSDTGSVTEDDDPDLDDLLEAFGNLNIMDPDVGESSFVTETVTGTYGDLSIDAVGNWDYSADNTQAAIQQLDGGQNVSDILSVTTADGTTHNIVITINGAEDAPVLGGTATGSVTEDGTLIDTDILTINDVDTNDNPLSFNDVGPVGGSGGYGTFEIFSNQWTYTLNNGLATVQALDVSETLTDSYTFAAADGSTQLVTVIINGAEDTPTVDNPIADQIATEDSAFSFTFADTAFGDVDSSDTLTFTATLDDDSTLPAWLSFNGSTRTFSGTPTNVNVGAINVKVIADDGTSSVFDTFSITVINTNDPPVIGGTDTGAVTEDIDPDGDNLLEVASALSIADDDAGESSFVAETITGSYGDLTIDVLGNWGYSADNTQAAIQQLDVGQSVTDTLRVTTADGTTHDIVITINGAEDVPVVQNNIPDQTAIEDAPFTFTFVANTFSDPDATDTLTYTATLSDDSALPSWLDFDAVTRTFSGTPEDADVGIISVKVTADDGASSVTDIFTITIVNTNDTPLAVDDSKETTENTSVTTYNVLDNDTPGDGITDVSSFDAVSSFGGTVLYNSDGTFTYAPAAGFTGDDTFTYTISDADGEMSTATVTVTVNPPLVTTPDPDPIEPDPDPDPDPIDTEEDPIDTEEETPTEDPEPTVVIVSDDEVAEPAIVEDVTEDAIEPAAKTLDKDPSDPADNTDASASAAASSEVLQDPGFMTSADNEAIVPDDLSVPIQEDHSNGSSTAANLLGKLEIDSTETTTLLLKRYLDQIDFLSEIDYSNAIEQLRNALDEFKEEAESEDHYYQTVIGSAIAVSTGLSVGYVVWLIRGGMLLSSMLFSMPAWQLADPLPLLAGGRDKDEEDEETLETIIRDSAGKNGNNRTTEAK